jgi:hypothetical protein
VYSTSTEASGAFKSKDNSASAGPGAVANCGSKLASRREFPGVVRSRNRRVHWLVLLGAETRVQQDSRAPLPV